MSDHAATAGASVIALTSTLQAYSMGLIGIPYLCVFWALLGALSGLAITPPETRRSAILTVLLSWAGGCLGGVLLEAYLGGGNAVLIGGAYVSGIAAKRAIPLLVDKLLNNLPTFGKK